MMEQLAQCRDYWIAWRSTPDWRYGVDARRVVDILLMLFNSEVVRLAVIDSFCLLPPRRLRVAATRQRPVLRWEVACSPRALLSR